jgi:chromosome condensin MukBEF complex kleisin-like MukF subunit
MLTTEEKAKEIRQYQVEQNRINEMVTVIDNTITRLQQRREKLIQQGLDLRLAYDGVEHKIVKEMDTYCPE